MSRLYDFFPRFKAGKDLILSIDLGLKPPKTREPDSVQNSSPDKKKRLAGVLFALFALAIVMGPGPGILLVNPEASDPGAARLFLGMPVVYVWAAFWFGVEALAVTLAYFLLWRKPA